MTSRVEEEAHELADVGLLSETNTEQNNKEHQMYNIELARKIVQHMTGDPVTARDIVQELDDAGLLAPDAAETDEHDG